MTRSLVVSIVLGLAMAATSALTGALTPQPRAPLAHERFDLAQMIPLRFGIWTVDPSVVPLTPNPEQQGMLEKIYDQTLSRTYTDPQGQRVMLSIAYGGDQSKSLQLHLPEVCYVAQGFEMVQDAAGVLPTRYAQVPVTRLVARLHERNEPITYWITIGDKATRTGIEQKLRRLAFGLSGEVPDGMLVRVSTVGNDARSGWRVQDRFVADMLAVLAPRERARLIGTDAPPAADATVAAGKKHAALQPGLDPTGASTRMSGAAGIVGTAATVATAATAATASKVGTAATAGTAATSATAATSGIAVAAATAGTTVTAATAATAAITATAGTASVLAAVHAGARTKAHGAAQAASEARAAPGVAGAPGAASQSLSQSSAVATAAPTTQA